MAAKGPARLFPLPDITPERLEGGYRNELLRFGSVVLRLEDTNLESAAWEHELLRFLRWNLATAQPLMSPATG